MWYYYNTRSLKTATVGDMCYYMGGNDANIFATDDVYRVSLPALVKSRNIDPSSDMEETYI